MVTSDTTSLLLAVLLPGLAAAQTAQDPGPGLTVERALALRSVGAPLLGDDFVVFPLIVPRPLAANVSRSSEKQCGQKLRGW